MPMSKMLRLTESQLHARVSASHGSLPADVVEFIEATGLSGEVDGIQAQTAGNRTDADMAGETSWIVTPYPIGTNRVWRNFNGRMVPNPKAEAWKRTAADSARLAGVSVATGDVQIHYRLHPKLNKDGSASKIRLDIDAPAKALLDALNGVAYLDDKQVIRLVGEVSHPVAGGALSVRITA